MKVEITDEEYVLMKELISIAYCLLEKSERPDGIEEFESKLDKEIKK